MRIFDLYDDLAHNPITLTKLVLIYILKDTFFY